MTWDYNCGLAGKSLGLDMLRNPNIVANDSTSSYKTALWYWMEYLHSFACEGFGVTIMSIKHDLKCLIGDYIRDTMPNSVIFYTEYCRQFGVSTGRNLQCHTETESPIKLSIYNNLVLKNFGLYLN